MRKEVMKTVLGTTLAEHTEWKRIMQLEASVHERELEVMDCHMVITKLRAWATLRNNVFQQKCIGLVKSAVSQVESLQRDKWRATEAQDLYSRCAHTFMSFALSQYGIHDALNS